MNDIKIVLENGISIPCQSFGLKQNIVGDFIFNTSLVGYQEVLTDPSYHQEVVVMTFPLQGIYGINNDDSESNHSTPLAFVVQEFEKKYSNAFATKSLDEYLKEKNIVGAAGVDTRHLTKIIRELGSLKGAIVDKDFSDKAALELIKNKKLAHHVEDVAPKDIAIFNPKGKKHVVFMDFGAKDSIVKEIIARGFKVTRVAYDMSAEKILALKPDVVFLSNGPGDPAELQDEIAEIKKLIAAKARIAGICLGHQLIAHAMGAKTYRLKFGHHSINHPVRDLETDKIFITSQNHNYSVDEKTLPKAATVFMRSLHDKTVEGIKHKDLPIICVQFHPEAAPGPSDANVLFDKFFTYLLGEKYAA